MSESTTPRVCVVVLNWNAAEETIRFVEMLGRERYDSLEIIVVDNGSSENDVGLIRARLKDVFVIENAENLGFAGGQNRGMIAALGRAPDYVLTINNDTELEAGGLRTLIEGAEEHANLGVIGPRVMHWENREILGASGGKHNLWTGVVRHLGSRQVARPPAERFVKFDFVSGTAMLFSRRALEKVGMLDPRFFFGGGEDVDICIRLRMQGFEVVHMPEVRLFHKGETRAKRWGSTYPYYILRNRFLLVKLHGSWLNLTAAFAWFIISSPLLVVLFFRRYGDLSALRAAARGLVDFARGK